jgi:hypothetical protein
MTQGAIMRGQGGGGGAEGTWGGVGGGAMMGSFAARSVLV